MTRGTSIFPRAAWERLQKPLAIPCAYGRHRRQTPAQLDRMVRLFLLFACSGGSKKRRAVKLTGETKVFEEGSMGEAPGGGSLSTYKELCALATEHGPA